MGDKHHRYYQKELRRRRDERAFLFDSTMSKCLAEVARNEWEWAIEMAGGSVSKAAIMAGIGNIPRHARALWGKTQTHALDSYRHWINRKAKMTR